MRNNYKNTMGSEFFLIFLTVIFLIVVSLSFAAVNSVQYVSSHVSSVYENLLMSEPYSFIKILSQQKAQKIEDILEKIALSSSMLAEQSGIIYHNLELFAQKPYQRITLQKGSEGFAFFSSATDPVIVVYGGQNPISPETTMEIQALSHLFPLLVKSRQALPECHSILVLTASKIRLNSVEDKWDKESFLKQYSIPMSDADRNEFVGKSLNIDSSNFKTGWTKIHQDPIGDELIVAANTSIPAEGLKGIVSVEIALNSLIHEVFGEEGLLSRGSSPILFAFLVDIDGRLVAFPESFYKIFGIKKRSEENTENKDTTLYLADSSKEAVRNLSQKILGSHSVSEKFQLDGEKYILTLSDIEAVGWRLGLVASEKVLLNSIGRTQNALETMISSLVNRFIYSSMAIIVLSVFLVFWMAHRITRPLRALTKAILKVTHGDLTAFVPKGCHGEAGALADSFNVMIARLRAAVELRDTYSHTLEKDIKERTIELETKNLELEVALIRLNEESSRCRRLVEAIGEREEFYRQTMEASLAGIFVYEDSLFRYVNSALERMSSYSREELVNKLGPLDLVIPEERAKIIENMQNRLSGEYLQPYMTKAICKDGRLFDALVYGKLTTWQKKPAVVATIIDITEQKIAEEQLRQREIELEHSLQEKEVLLREIYHRSKNNMLVIISMLNLSMDGITDEKALTVLNETEGRIRAMSLVHEKLYQSKNLSEIDLGSYLQDMVTSLLETMMVAGRIEADAEIIPVPITIDHAVPLGLVVNEIVTNSVKHAFPERRKGKISLKLRQNEDKEIEIILHDNGIGISTDIIKNKDVSFGLQIIFNLVEQQLLGTCSVNRNNGTEYLIRFAEPKRPVRI
jgi:PAS domain S-box-containing protein